MRISSTMVIRLLAAGAVVLSTLSSYPQDTSISVESKRKPPNEWKGYSTRTMAQLPPSVRTAKPDVVDTYGGLLSSKDKSTGFFHTTKVGGRWWLIDPEGCRFFNVGVASVRPGSSQTSKTAFTEQFANTEKWASVTTKLLQDNAFNGVGAWSETDALRKEAHPVAYTVNWGFMSTYGSKRGGTYHQPGHLGYPNDCIFVFDPEFEKFCDEHAKQLSATSKDPWLLGHFSDNEMPLPDTALDKFLGLPKGDPGRLAAEAWVTKRLGHTTTTAEGTISTETLTQDDRNAFLGVIMDRYFRIVSKAIRKYDPNHLYLGSRLNGSSLRHAEVFRAMAPYVDVLSINYYSTWTPKLDRIGMWTQESGKPFIVSEFYIKAEDSGLGNNTGAGWIVRTQKERGQFYQNYVLGLIESRSCVGWHWFRYMDNDPGEATDAAKQDSNKGIVDIRYAPYTILLSAMKELNSRVYTLADYFDRSRNEQ